MIPEKPSLAPSDAPTCSALQDTPTPKTDAIEHACNRQPIVLGYIKMRDHAKEIERQLQQTKGALHAAHKDRLADAKSRRNNHSVKVTDMVWLRAKEERDAQKVAACPQSENMHGYAANRLESVLLALGLSLPNA
jgi:hypothetical protein